VNDGYTDFNRPNGTNVIAYGPDGQPVSMWFNSSTQLWYPPAQIPQIQFQPASPMSSPPQQYGAPIGGNGPSPHYLQVPLGPSASAFNPSVASQSAPINPTQFPARIESRSPAGVLSARMLLDFDVPNVAVLTIGLASTSSASNGAYATVNWLTDWPLPPQLCGYGSLAADLKYSANDPDPTIQITAEADAIWASRLYLVTPVNIVLYYNISRPYRVRCSSEDSHSVRLLVDGKSVEHLSRVDLSWSVEIPRRGWQRFALLEFKRPGAVRTSEWAPGTRGDPVVNSADKICRQLAKYAYSFDIPFVGVCDWDYLVLLRLQGTREQCREGYLAADIRWIENPNEMKRNLYVFLKEAFEDCLRRNGLSGFTLDV
jgi:hypothetical protein